MQTSSGGEAAPSVLVSYVNLKWFLKGGGWHGRWVLDSGAYSALTSGASIELSRYIDDCHSLLAAPDAPEVVFSLDVIGDPEATAKNTDAMVAAGIPAVPTFHYGSPRHYLEGLARSHERVAIGGTAGRGKNGHGAKVHRSQKVRFFDACFSTIWPKWAHGFGAADPAILARFPFASCDSTTWFYGPSRYGFSLLTGNQTVPKRSSVGPKVFDAFITREVAEWRKLERKTAGTFGAVMRRASLPSFTMRFAVGSAKEINILKGAHV